MLTRYLHFNPVIYASFWWKWTNYSRSIPKRLQTGQKDLSECNWPSLKCDLSQGSRGQRLKVMRRMKRCYLTALLSLFVSIEPLAGPCLSTSKHWPNIVCQPWPLTCCYAASFTQEFVCVCAGRVRQWAEAKQKPAVSPTPWSIITFSEFPLSVSDSSTSRLLGFIVCEKHGMTPAPTYTYNSQG